MSLDSLLLLLSAKCEGSWAQFRAAVEALHVPENTGDASVCDGQTPRDGFPIYRQVQFALNALCHVEFSTERVARASPVIAATDYADGRALGILCGERTPGLLQKLQAHGEVQYDATSSPEMPQRVGLIAESMDLLKTLASSHDMFLQESAPLALLLATPPVDSKYSWKLQEMPKTPGWVVHRFSHRSLGWEERSQGDALASRFGLFRFTQTFQRYYFLSTNGSTFQVPVQIGNFVVLGAHKRKVLSYSEEHRS